MADLLPIGQAIPAPQRKALFFRVNDIPFGNRSLAFSVMLPKTWGVDSSLKVANGELTPAALKPLAIFRGMSGDEAYAYLQIQAMLLTREISAASWLQAWALSEGYTVRETRELSPLFVDALLEFFIDETPFTMRAAVKLDGNRLFLVKAFVPSVAYAAMEQTFGLMVASFELAQPGPTPHIESRAHLHLAGRLRLQHPMSWRPRVLTDLPDGRAAVDLYQIDDADALQGLLRIKLAEKRVVPSSSTMLASAQAELAEADVTLEEEIHNGPIESPVELYKSGQLVIYLASINGSPTPQEVWIYLFETSTHFVAMTLLTPSREAQYYPWAINKRAFELVLDSIKFVA